jgi:hypothetical protein
VVFEFVVGTFLAQKSIHLSGRFLADRAYSRNNASVTIGPRAHGRVAWSKQGFRARQYHPRRLLGLGRQSKAGWYLLATLAPEGVSTVRAMSTLELSNDDFLKVRARNLALGKTMHETCVGEVDGIRFDLRDKEINPHEWTMDHLGGADGYPPRRVSNLPFIWFPWYENLMVIG